MKASELVLPSYDGSIRTRSETRIIRLSSVMEQTLPSSPPKVCSRRGFTESRFIKTWIGNRPSTLEIGDLEGRLLHLFLALHIEG